MNIASIGIAMRGIQMNDMLTFGEDRKKKRSEKLAAEELRRNRMSQNLKIGT